MIQHGSSDMTYKQSTNSGLTRKSEKEEPTPLEQIKPAILKSSQQSSKVYEDTCMTDLNSKANSSVKPFNVESNDKKKLRLTSGEDIREEMERRRKQWATKFKNDQLTFQDRLEYRNPQAVAEFLPSILENMRLEESRHLYPTDFLAPERQS